MGQNYFPDDGEDVLVQALQVKIATLAFAGMTKAAMAKEMKISTRRVNTLLQDEETMRQIRKLRDECVETAKVIIKKGAANLAKQVVAVIEHHLDNNNLNAVPHALKILDFGVEEQAKETGTSITVVMPDTGIKPKTVNSEGEDV